MADTSNPSSHTEENGVSEMATLERATSNNLMWVTLKYFIYAVLIIGSIYLIYYLYNRQKSQQTTSDTFVKGNTPERDDVIADFNLHEAIKDLEKSQQNILKNLSDDVNI